MNVYTIDQVTYKQASAGAALWNAKTYTDNNGYAVSFQVNVVAPKVMQYTEQQVIGHFKSGAGGRANKSLNFYRKNGKLKQGMYNNYLQDYVADKTKDMAFADPQKIGNSYLGANTKRSRHYTSTVYDPQKHPMLTTANGNTITAHTLDGRSFGTIAEAIAHELGHGLGLSDYNDPPVPGKFYSPGGVMDYSKYMNGISDADVQGIIDFYYYRRNTGSLNGKGIKMPNGSSLDDGRAQVYILEEIPKNEK